VNSSKFIEFLLFNVQFCPSPTEWSCSAKQFSVSSWDLVEVLFGWRRDDEKDLKDRSLLVVLQREWWSGFQCGA
jgi:hypothetical protein